MKVIKMKNAAVLVLDMPLKQIAPSCHNNLKLFAPTLAMIGKTLFFFNVGPPKEDFFSEHLLCPIFQSSYMLQLQISLKAQ